MKENIMVDFDGEPMPLKHWARKHGLCDSTLYYRWHRGCRDIDSLVKGLQPSPDAPITEEDIKYLRETKYARSGQWNEWEIACDLIGIGRHRAKEVKEALCSRS